MENGSKARIEDTTTDSQPEFFLLPEVSCCLKTQEELESRKRESEFFRNKKIL